MLLLFFFTQVDSITMAEAVEIAVKNSPVYLESRANLDRSRINFYQNLAGLLPTASASGSLTKTKFDSLTSDAYTGSISLTMPVFDLDVLSAIAVARGQAAGSRIQHESEIASLILRVKTSYYNLINGRELINSSEIALERARRNSDLVTAKYDLGSASRLEVLQAEVFYLRAMQDRARARTLETTAREELKTLLGVNREFVAVDTIPEPDTVSYPSLDTLLAQLQSVNYNIRVATELHNIARLNLWASYLSFLPRVSVFWGKTLTSDSLVFDYDYFNDNARTNYGINVVFPIFEIKGLIFRNLNARNDLRQKRYGRIRTVLETEKALKTSYFSLQESHERLQYARKSYDAADEAARIAAERYALGALSLVDLLSTESSSYETRVAYIQSLTDYYVQRANFSFLIGAAAE